MHIITRKRLNEFAEQQPETKSALAHWYREMKRRNFTSFADLRTVFPAADQVGKLTVFQRRPNWCAPLNNGLISSEEMADIRSRYDEIFDKCSRSPGGFEYEPDHREVL